MRKGAALLLAACSLLSLDCGPKTERARVLREMASRPTDPWPRGKGHVLLAFPGTPEDRKGYEEPGGSFSPAAPSFGISFWIVDSGGRIAATSDSLRLSDMHTRFSWSDGKLPALETTTAFYTATWRATEPGEYRLEMDPHRGPDRHLEVVIRSVGPAGGRVQAIRWNDRHLLINDRWTVAFLPGATFLASGREGDTHWMSDTGGPASSEVSDGWGYARVRIDAPGAIVIHDGAPATAALPFETTRAAVSTGLPDPAFQESLDAQTAHQTMALVSNQTRPGDPMNYPLAWQRDGAYTVVSLARAGRLELARQLAGYVAEHDFYGGFGAEADAPGLGIWAIEETASRLHDAAFDAAMFPAVKRKAGWIERMLQTREPLRADFDGPLVPEQVGREDSRLLADGSRGGLIMGRVDHHRPVLFVNAVSYAGLIDAAAMADRTHEPELSTRWRTLASNLRNAWAAALSNTEWRGNDRTFISGLWPTWTVIDRATWAQALDGRWTKSHDSGAEPIQRPVWTYFNVAEAHQFLLVGRPDRAWRTVEWFWNHQDAPGLYTWWEGGGEENTSHKWEDVRGWVRPHGVAPHYWTAAEMLLLQLDMLAYADEGAAEPTLVIGAGVKPEWLRSPMTVRGVSTRLGVVDWRWTGSRLLVHWRGAKVRFTPGTAFPTGVPVSMTSDRF